MSRTAVARFAAPLAFLLAATVAVLLVRSALDRTEPAGATRTAETAPPATAERPAETATVPPPAAAAEDPEFYVIQAGDTLEAIASANGTTVEQLLLLNPTIDPVALTIGQRVRVR